MILRFTCLILAFNLSFTINNRGFTIEELPEYVVIQTEVFTRGTSGRILEVDGRRKSRDEKALTKLEDYLQDKKRSGVKYHTDLLNEMSDIGYDFIQAIKNDEVDYLARYIFRKKAKFRDQ